MTTPDPPRDEPGRPSAGAVRDDVRPVAGHKLRTLEAGEEGRPVVLLLHGLPGSAEGWRPLVGALGTRFHAVAVDRPGYGATGGPPLPAPAQVEVAGELLASLGAGAGTPAGPALVVGHSYGSVLASGLAARAPEQVGALALVAPVLHLSRWAPPGFDGVQRFVAGAAGEALLRATLLSTAGRARLAAILSSPSFSGEPVGPRELADSAELLRYESVRSALFEARHTQEHATRAAAAVGSLAIPATVIHGLEDRSIPAAAGRRTAAAIPRCTHHELSGGHMVIVSQAPAIAALIGELAGRAGLSASPPP